MNRCFQCTRSAERNERRPLAESRDRFAGGDMAEARPVLLGSARQPMGKGKEQLQQATTVQPVLLGSAQRMGQCKPQGKEHTQPATVQQVFAASLPVGLPTLLGSRAMACDTGKEMNFGAEAYATMPVPEDQTLDEQTVLLAGSRSGYNTDSPGQRPASGRKLGKLEEDDEASVESTELGVTTEGFTDAADVFGEDEARILAMRTRDAVRALLARKAVRQERLGVATA